MCGEGIPIGAFGQSRAVHLCYTLLRMTIRLGGKTLTVRFGRIFLCLFLLLIVWGVGSFFFRTYEYYRAIRSGVSNPLLEQKLDSSFSHAVANSNVTAADLAQLAASPTATLGTKGAPLTIVEFLDFDCPFCQASFGPVHEMVQKYHDKVYLIIRNFPLTDIHPRALAAALAARCAAEQGKFWPYHDQLYINQDHHEDTDLAQYARNVGLDGTRFDQCYQSQKYQPQIQRDVQDGLQAGIQGTPTFFFNGIKIQGGLTSDTLEFLIKKFLKL